MIYGSLVPASGWNHEFSSERSLPPHAKSRKAALPFPAAAREAAILMTCTDTKVDINKRRWMWTIRVTCLAAGLAGEQGKQVKKTQESYLYKLQGQGVCHYLLENLILTCSFFWFPSVSSFTYIQTENNIVFCKNHLSGLNTLKKPTRKQFSKFLSILCLKCLLALWNIFCILIYYLNEI